MEAMDSDSGGAPFPVFEPWSPDPLRRYAWWLALRLDAHWGADLNRAELLEFVEEVLHWSFSGRVPSMAAPGKAWKRWLEATVDEARSDVFEDRVDIFTYAFEIRLATRQQEPKLAPPGRVLLRLSGRDAVRWLLTVESIQSCGPEDPWRLAPSTARNLLREPERWWSEADEARAQRYDARPCSFSRETLARLSGLGLITYREEPDPRATFYQKDIGYRLEPEGCTLLEEIATGEDTTFSILARSLLDDLVALTLRVAAPQEPATSTEPDRQAHVRQMTRHVVHEIRNRLVPSRQALSSLSQVLEENPSNHDRAGRYLDRTGRGLESALRFLDDMAEMDRISEPSRFEPLSAVRDAITELDPDLRPLVHVESGGAPGLYGDRARFTLAVLNILRNAFQALPPDGDRRVEVSLSHERGNAIVTVDDTGAGVPPPERTRIFERGVSLGNGGSGLGLDLVRELIEDELRGEVRCEDSPLGGARFRLLVPTEVKE